MFSPTPIAPLQESMCNTSLAAPGALAHRLQRRTACNAAPPASGPQNGRWGLERCLPLTSFSLSRLSFTTSWVLSGAVCLSSTTTSKASISSLSFITFATSLYKSIEHTETEWSDNPAFLPGKRSNTSSRHPNCSPHQERMSPPYQYTFFPMGCQTVKPPPMSTPPPNVVVCLCQFRSVLNCQNPNSTTTQLNLT